MFRDLLIPMKWHHYFSDKIFAISVLINRKGDSKYVYEKFYSIVSRFQYRQI